MYGRPRLNVKLNEVEISRLRVTFLTLYFIYARKIYIHTYILYLIKQVE